MSKANTLVATTLMLSSILGVRHEPTQMSSVYAVDASVSRGAPPLVGEEKTSIHLRLLVDRMHCNHITSESEAPVPFANNDKDEVYFNVVRGSANSRIPEPSVEEKEPIFEFENGHTAEGWEWFRDLQERKSLPKPILWEGEVSRNEKLFILCAIQEQENNELGVVGAFAQSVIDWILPRKDVDPETKQWLTTAQAVIAHMGWKGRHDVIGIVSANIELRDGKIVSNWECLNPGRITSTDNHTVSMHLAGGLGNGDYNVTLKLLAVDGSVEPLDATYGGDGGGEFTAAPPPDADLSRLTLRFSNILNGLQCVWGNQTSEFYGNAQAGNAIVIELEPGEHISALTVRVGQMVDAIFLETTRGRRLPSSGWYGGGGGTVEHRFQAPPDSVICGFRGRRGADIDRIGVLIRAPVRAE